VKRWGRGSRGRGGKKDSLKGDFFSTLRNGEEKGGEKEGFEAGGEAARLKPLSIPPSPRREAAAGRGG